MGRPRDVFAWSQVEESENGIRTCIHCGDKFKGGVTRIRNHLSGKGTDILACTAAPDAIREEAMNKFTGKRGRENPSVQDPSIRTSNGPVSITKRATREHVTSDLLNKGTEDQETRMMINGLESNSCFQTSAFATTTMEAPSSSVDAPDLGFGMGVGVACSTPQLGNPLFTPSSYLITNQDSSDRRAEDSLNGALQKFLMCTNSDFINNPHFRNLLTCVRHNGVPSSLLCPENRLLVERSVLTIKEEIYDNIKRLQESWKTTGCTLMVFNLKESEYVYGFYSSKGFFFVRADEVMRYWPKLDLKMITHTMDHPNHHWFFQNHNCEFRGEEGSDPIEGIQSHLVHTTSVSCLRRQIIEKCIASCIRSKWAWSMIQKAGGIHKLIAECYLCKWFSKSLEGKPEFEELGGGEIENPLSRFISIILLEWEIKRHLLCSLGSGLKQQQEQLIALIYHEPTFWDEGRELLRALTPILRIPFDLDTLVPTAGYLDKMIDNAKNVICKDNKLPQQDDVLWGLLMEFLDDKSVSGIRQPVASYLNPFYFRDGDVHKDLSLKDIVKVRLRGLAGVKDQEEMDKQLQCYSDNDSNPMPNYLGLLIEHCDPVKLWEKYGDGLPLLRKHAIKILSQPVSCMCNQVKKQMLHLEGEADYILRLNVRMMQEYNKGSVWLPNFGLR